MPASQTDERTPIVPATESAPQSKLGGVLLVIAVCATQIGFSASLINFNKFVMAEDHFPHSVVLTSMHMLSSFVLASLLYLVCGDSFFPGVKVVKQEGAGLFTKLLPLSVCFAVSVALSNEAYRYSGVPFLQMCKQGNIVMVYVVGLLMLVEKWNIQQAAILLIIFVGCSTAVTGEVTFSRMGFLIQISSQLCEVIKIMLQQKLMHGLKLDPLTTVMVMSPACMITLSAGVYYRWTDAVLPAAYAMWPYLVLNCLNAFALNIAVAAVIKNASGLGFVLTGVIKDITIVTTAATFFGAEIARQQIVGFTIATLGIAVHSIIRTLPEMTRDHGVSKALCFAMFGMQPTVRQAPDVEAGK